MRRTARAPTEALGTRLPVKAVAQIGTKLAPAPDDQQQRQAGLGGVSLLL